MRYSLFFFLFLFSCTYNEIVLVCDPNEEVFNNEIKSIIDNNCASCHHTSSGRPAILTTYEGVVDAVRYNELVNWIISEEMPPSSMPPLNQSEITIVKNWADCE